MRRVIGMDIHRTFGEVVFSPSLAPKVTAATNGFQAPLLYLQIMENSPKTSVLYNANCPVCNFEIQHYARYAAPRPADPV